MNKDEIGGNWKQFKGKAKEQWGKLTDDDMTVIEGKRDQLVGKIQERYGYEKDQAENEVKDWETRKRLPLVTGTIPKGGSEPPFSLALTRLFLHQDRVIVLTGILMTA